LKEPWGLQTSDSNKLLTSQTCLQENLVREAFYRLKEDTPR
jgi:hypothetical protein